jgi:hypothetical protein
MKERHWIKPTFSDSGLTLDLGKNPSLCYLRADLGYLFNCPELLCFSAVEHQCIYSYFKLRQFGSSQIVLPWNKIEKVPPVMCGQSEVWSEAKSGSPAYHPCELGQGPISSLVKWGTVMTPLLQVWLCRFIRWPPHTHADSHLLVFICVESPPLECTEWGLWLTSTQQDMQR